MGNARPSYKEIEEKLKCLNQSVTATWEYIDKQKAITYLENNEINRKLGDGNVSKFVKEMKDGEWQINGETIVFSKTGKLKNGQHRLNAIVEADTGIFVLVVRGVEDDVIVYDRGKNRSLADTFAIDGYDSKGQMSRFIPAAKLHLIVQRKTITSTYVADSDIRDVLDFYKKDIITMDAAGTFKYNHKRTTGGKINLNNAPFFLASLYAYKCGVSLETINRFKDVFSSGFYNGDKESAAIVIRNDYLSGNVSSHNTKEREQSLHKFEKAIYDFSNSTSRKQSYNNWDNKIFSNDSRIFVKTE